MKTMRFVHPITFPALPGSIVALATGVVAAAIGFLIPGILGGRGPEWGVLAMMLTAAPATLVFSRKAEQTSSTGWFKEWHLVFLYFLGVMVGVSAWCVFHQAGEVWQVFGFLRGLPEVSLATFDQGRFPPAWQVIPHNLGVALALVFLTLLFGIPGGTTLLTWNACVWSITLTMMVLRSSESTAYSTSILAILPHTLVELAAYSLIVLTAADFRHSPSHASPEWARLAMMLCLVVILIVIAGLLESTWTLYVLDYRVP